MDVIELAADVAADRRGISFRLSGQRGEIVCAITPEALEAQFWLPADADQGHMLKAPADGRERIIAVAERKIRWHPGEVIRLTTDDFLIKRRVSGGRRQIVAHELLPAIVARTAPSFTS